jgi:peptidyl-prolyl cis-trans isomerase SurA
LPALVCLFALAASSAARAAVIEAIVNDEIITTQDLLKQAKTHGEWAKADAGGQTALLRAALQELIESKLIEAEGKRHVDANPLLKDHIERAVQQEIEKQRVQFRGENNLRDHIEKTYAMTYTEYRKKLWQDQVRRFVVERDVTVGITVRPSEMRDYYEKHRSRFRKSAAATYRVIYLRAGPRDDREAQRRLAADLVRRARAGEDFSGLSRDFSTGAGEAAGLRENVPLDDLAETLRKAIQSLKPGEVSEPVEADDAIRILKIESFTPEEVQPFEQVQEDIHQIVRDLRWKERYVDLVKRLWRQNYVWVRGAGRLAEPPGA